MNQAFFLTGQDLSNYLTTNRPDPCITQIAGQLPSQAVKQVDPCLGGSQLQGCKLIPCNKSNPLLCIDPYCFSSSCFKADQSTPWTSGCPPGTGQCCNDNFLYSACLNQPCSSSGATLDGIFRFESNDPSISNKSVQVTVLLYSVKAMRLFTSIRALGNQYSFPHLKLRFCCAGRLSLCQLVNSTL